ncbi:NADH dehydrogenase [ubiquinone] 1 alpha subcomplex assembly factor 2 isoform X2 [Poeciliopsis prolifica]|uniref:NADH dehydrogenase [ubiquinone] 1 alpha subcomplex assembly factor 2 isoform X2 n=1 Tax=Poeciliopsis prolifica TaxID=188132 RepID=UPI002413BF03|nr:NADH dehydrogenase [ubiquinone] 1 alpha subcomplex assembly factor 2 isoform X2 [Poeciliopsis prolifica]
MNKIAGLLRRTFGIVREHVGTDHLGNKYYSIPEQKTWTAWMRGRRKEPPSIEELMMHESQMNEVKLKAKEMEEKDLALQAKDYEEGLVATPGRTVAKGHASATVFGKEELSEEPTSTANKFQPGSWTPTSKK